MKGIPTGPGVRIVWETLRDGRRVIRSWFDPRLTKARIGAAKEVEVLDIATAALEANRELFWIDRGALRLVDEDNPISGGRTVRWEQVHNGIPVVRSQVVVNLSADGAPALITNDHHYGIPRKLGAEAPRVPGKDALRKIEKFLAPVARGFKGLEFVDDRTRLVIYRWRSEARNEVRGFGGPESPLTAIRDLSKEIVRESLTARDAPRHDQYFLAWQIVLVAARPSGRWRILVDAMTGRILQFLDRAHYVDAQGHVFDPNPVVSSGMAFHWDPTNGLIDNEVQEVKLEHLDDPDVDSLAGNFVVLKDLEPPDNPAAAYTAANEFRFAWDTQDFLATMAYYHIDRFQGHVKDALGISGAHDWAIPVDARAHDDFEGSRYVNGEIFFGRGDVPDASDADLILHEYAHAIHYAMNGAIEMYATGIKEGFADFVAAVWFDEQRRATDTRWQLFLWDTAGDGSGPAWAGRRYDVDWTFDADPYSSADGHLKGQLWARSTFDVYLNLGGGSDIAATRTAARDVVLRLHILAFLKVSHEPAVYQMVNAFELVDETVGDGLHKKVIHDVFRQRRTVDLATDPVDVYIDDGRAGGYEWQEVFWNTKDIWVKNSPYPDAGSQAAGSNADHEQPVVGSTSYVYVRIKNRGTVDSGEITVKLYSCDPSIGLVWPDHWIPADGPKSATTVPVGTGPADGVVVGPFEFKAAKEGHECLLAIVESAEDTAITQDLPGVQIPDPELIRFDNNIAQRNIIPLAATTGSSASFSLINPDREETEVELDFDIPDGCRVRTDLEDSRALLGPGKSKTVRVTIQPPAKSGGAVVRIRGIANGRVIGGIDIQL